MDRPEIIEATIEEAADTEYTRGPLPPVPDSAYPPDAVPLDPIDQGDEDA